MHGSREDPEANFLAPRLVGMLQREIGIFVDWDLSIISGVHFYMDLDIAVRAQPLRRKYILSPFVLCEVRNWDAVAGVDCSLNPLMSTVEPAIKLILKMFLVEFYI